ncbi:MAG: vitamin K epoxide reductase family protein [Terracidiphilus sp.]
MRYLIALVALAGVAVSALALRVHYSTNVEPCSINERWDCGIVNRSPFAEIAHIPVAAIGIAGYLALAGLALARRRAVTLSAALIGLAFALYLSHIERDVLMVWCLYCVISLGIVALLTLLSLGWLIAERIGRRRAQSRLTKLGPLPRSPPNSPARAPACRYGYPLWTRPARRPLTSCARNSSPASTEPGPPSPARRAP